MDALVPLDTVTGESSIAAENKARPSADKGEPEEECLL